MNQDISEQTTSRTEAEPSPSAGETQRINPDFMERPKVLVTQEMMDAADEMWMGKKQGVR